MASPSGSEAVTSRVKEAPSPPLAVAAAVTAGARSVLATAIAVALDLESAFEAVKGTLYGSARLSLKDGGQGSVPVALPGPGGKTPFFPARDAERAAASPG